MRTIFRILPLVFLLTSCQVYRDCFDCPPPCGVCCASVSEIESMILETPDGSPDIFTGVSRLKTQDYCGPCAIKKCPRPKMKRVWIEDECSCDLQIEGHYIYFSDDGEPCDA